MGFVEMDKGRLNWCLETNNSASSPAAPGPDGQPQVWLVLQETPDHERQYVQLAAPNAARIGRAVIRVLTGQPAPVGA
jgi:hypothetical protein